MGKENVLNYFKKGFLLVNKSGLLFVVALILSLPIGLLFSNTGNFFIDKAVLIAETALLFIWSGFIFSLPIFLKDRQEGKSFQTGFILSTSFASAIKLVLPLLIIGGIITLVFLAFFYIITSVFNFDIGIDPIPLFQIDIFWIVISVLFTIFMSLTTFVPLYFSLGRTNFYQALQKSILFSFKNINFFLVVFLVYTTSSLIIQVVQNFQYITPVVRQLVSTGFSEYVILFIQASALVFYQKMNENRN